MKAGWEVKPVGEVCEVKGGKRVPKGSKLQAIPTPYPYVSVSDFTEDGTVSKSKLKYISEDIHTQIARYAISSNDIYFSIAGTIGKTGSVPIELDGANLTENACKLVLRDGLDKRFLYYLTLSVQFVDQVKLKTRTTAQPKLSLERLKSILIPLPPLEEQKRIVAVLDGAFDALTRARAHTEANLLNARELFESNVEASFSNSKRKEALLSELISISHGFAFKSADFEASSDESLPVVLTPGNYTEEAEISTKGPKTKRLKGSIPKGVLFSKGELTVVMTDLSSKMKILGKPAFIETENMLHNQRIGRIKFIGSGLDARFLYYFLRTRFARDEVRNSATGTMVRHTAPKRILALAIPMPETTAAQNKITKELDQLSEDVRKLRQFYQQKLTDIDDLRQSLLQKAFAGELT